MDGRRTLGWVLVIIAVVWLILPMGWLLGRPFGHSGIHLGGVPFWFGFGALGWVINLLLAVWVGWDANQRGQNGLLWGLLVLFTSVVGLVVYLLFGATAELRAGPPPPPPGPGGAAAARCRQCGAATQPGYRVCPYCGTPTQAHCTGCQRPVESGWKVCPYCEARLD